jgi:hypothetical protein
MLNLWNLGERIGENNKKIKILLMNSMNELNTIFTYEIV